MNLISATGISKNMGGKTLFKDARFGIDSGDRIGLVGPNGSGKSTLLSLIMGTLEPDEGVIARKRDLRLAMLEQSPAFLPGDDLRGFLNRSDAPVMRLVREYEACLDSMHRGLTVDAELARLTHRMEEEGGFAVERRFSSFLSELGLPSLETPMSSMSGGMVKKAAIARVIAQGAELLVIDEPTNHLDVETIEWLETRLSQESAAFVLVTHDRRFLDAACSSMMDIDRETLNRYEGGWADYVERRIERAELADAAESKRVAILRDELEWLKRGPKARGGKDKQRKARIRGMLDAAPADQRGIDGFSSGTQRLGRKVLDLEKIAKSYDGRVVLAPFSYAFTRGEHIGVVGPNGSGKTTLLDIASGRIAPDAGRVVPGETLSLAYFGQTNAEVDMTMTVLAYASELGDRVTLADGTGMEATFMLERFGFGRDMQERQLSRLSGGELRRLRFVRLLLESPNFLVLDEPTNDFDIETIELIETFLDDVPGCVLMVSHDRAFLDRVADRLFALDGEGGIRDIAGGWNEYREIMRSEREAASARTREAKDAAGVASSQASSQAGASKAGKRLSFAERREYDGIETRIAALEDELKTVEAGFASGAGVEEASRRYAPLKEELERTYARWEELASRADGS